MQALWWMQTVKSNAKHRLCLPMQAIYKSSKTPSNTGSFGNPESRSPIFHYNCLNPVSVRELPLPHLSYYPSRKSGLEGGRKVYVVLTTVWCQIQTCT